LLLFTHWPGLCGWWDWISMAEWWPFGTAFIPTEGPPSIPWAEPVCAWDEDEPPCPALLELALLNPIFLNLRLTWPVLSTYYT
jgi:hypothetical protein